MRHVRPRRLLMAALLLGTAVAAGCSRPASVGHAVTLAVPGTSNESPTVAADGDRVAVTWLGVRSDRRADVYIAVSRDGGATFASPIRVNTQPGEARASQQQAPRLAMAPGRLAVMWTARYDDVTEMTVAESQDDGRTFGTPVRVTPAGMPGTRGWGSLAFDASGRLRVVWLDTRVGASAGASSSGAARPDAGGHSMHEHAGVEPNVSATRQDVWTAILEPDGRVVEHMLAADVCFCCKTTVARAGARVGAAWRDVYEADVRDISFAWISETGDAPRVRVSEDQWHVAGCPEDGPTLAAGADGALHLVWPTMVVTGDSSKKGVFYADSRDGGAFAPRVRLDADTGGAHPAVAVAGTGDVLAAWDIVSASGRAVVARRRTGNVWQPPIVLSDAASSPSAAATNTTFVVAWEQQAGENRTIRVGHVPGSR